MSERVFVTDFDGTITATDFYDLAVKELLIPEDLTPWSDYRAGKITHFEAMRRIFSRIKGPVGKVLEVVDETRPDPELAASVAALREAGWDIIIASAGCRWYIDYLLGKAGVGLEVHANPGTYADNGPLLMELPETDPFLSREDGIDKAAIVKWHQARGKVVVYAGDGFTDLPASLLVPAKLRFARADLADSLDERSEPYRPFAAWSEIARTLLAEGEAL